MFSSDDGNKHNIIAEPTSVYYIAEKLIKTKFLTIIQRLLQQRIQLFYSDHPYSTQY